MTSSLHTSKSVNVQRRINSTDSSKSTQRSRINSTDSSQSTQRKRINSTDSSQNDQPVEHQKQRQKTRWKLPRTWQCSYLCRYCTRNLRHILSILFLACVVFYYGASGPGTMRGGMVGNYIDKRLLRYNIRNAFQERQERLLQAGVVLPILDIRNNRFQKELPSPFGQLAVTLARIFPSKQQVWDAEQFAGQWKEKCNQTPSSTSTALVGANRNNLNIPSWILQPNEGDWYRPLQSGPIKNSISFDESDMQRLIRREFPEILPVYDAATTKTTRIYIWTICALYWYGGYAFGSSVRDVTPLTNLMAKLEGHSCADHAVILLEGQTKDRMAKQEDTSDNMKWQMLAASPRHPQLHCLIQKMGRRRLPVDFFDGDQLGNTAKSGDKTHQSSDWLKISSSCLEGEKDCCGEATRRGDLASLSSSVDSHMFIKDIEQDELSRGSYSSAVLWRGPRVEVSISEVPSSEPVGKVTKVAIRQILDNAGCRPSWLCNRCLRTVLFGSFESCSFVCSSCYETIQCTTASAAKSTRSAHTRIEVREKRARVAGETLIPRIIHQTFPDSISTMTYPELSRLQNSWRYSGFEFRFYNDSDARDYIETNFPLRFLNAYDSFLPGAFKADFFRLLVLLKDGGIYADADVQLETNLDTFLTPDLSFFVPRETVRDLMGQDFCLWNGLLGASPGHPIIVKAVERVLQAIAQRSDYYDVEQDTCRDDGRSSPIWKLRSLPTLILSGPCALGMSVNEALGRKDLLASFDPGWLPPLQKAGTGKHHIGDSLILLGDKHDMGYFRFSDVDRNLIVASTDMTGLWKKSALDPPGKSHLRSHYSETEFLSDIYGMEGLYADKLVTNNEDVKLDLVYVDT